MELGADPNAVDGVKLAPLHACCTFEYTQERLDCARELLKAGANVNAVSNPAATPLDLAAQCSQPPMIRLLLEYKLYGANLSSTKENGPSPAQIASRYSSNPDVTQLLRESEVKWSTEKAPAPENDSSIDQRGRWEGESKSKMKGKERH